MWTPAYDLTPMYAELMARAGRPVLYTSVGQGLGWVVFTLEGQELVTHGGADQGFRSDVLLWPAESSAVVVLLNDEAADPGELSRIIFSMLRTAGRE
jgi:hypothetical protein